MDRETRDAAIAAAIILAGFGLLAYILPSIMLRLGNYSPYAAGAFGLVFLFSFFVLFWLRSRHKR